MQVHSIISKKCLKQAHPTWEPANLFITRLFRMLLECLSLGDRLLYGLGVDSEALTLGVDPV